jgi:glycosyltransferase involved in cell wall biosynthesis
VVRIIPLLLREEAVAPYPEKFILYQGALNKGRGLEQLILAMHHLPLRLFIAGDGDLRQELHSLVKKEGLSYKINFTGKLTPAELRALTPQAWLGYNLLEVESRSYYFSLSNKFFDYIHAGVPGLSNPLPEYTSINNQYKVAELIDLSTENIVNCVRKLLQEATFYDFMKSECKRASQVLNWQEEEKVLLDLYARL